jgi:hypothetical protein
MIAGPPETNQRENAEWQVGLSSPPVARRPGEESSPITESSSPTRKHFGVTQSKVRAILGIGLGKRENPRPSSRETAKPPRWVSDAGGNRHQPSVQKGSPLTFCAERTEAGPGPEPTCQQNRSDANKRPCGELATHFMGVLVLRNCQFRNCLLPISNC